jgi:hypothetical protein
VDIETGRIFPRIFATESDADQWATEWATYRGFMPGKVPTAIVVEFEEEVEPSTAEHGK